MSSWYDPPEDDYIQISGPDYWVTTDTAHSVHNTVVCSMCQLREFTPVSGMDFYVETKKLGKQGYEVSIEYGYAWRVDGEEEWYFSSSERDANHDAVDAHMKNLEDAREAMAEAAREAQYDRD